MPTILLRPRRLDEYGDIIGPNVLTMLRRLAAPLAGLRVLHLSAGPFGSAVAETLARAGVGAPLTTLGVQDRFAEAGSLTYLLERHGLTPRAIADAAMTPSASGRGGALGAPGRGAARTEGERP